MKKNKEYYENINYEQNPYEILDKYNLNSYDNSFLRNVFDEAISLWSEKHRILAREDELLKEIILIKDKYKIKDEDYTVILIKLGDLAIKQGFKSSES